MNTAWSLVFVIALGSLAQADPGDGDEPSRERDPAQRLRLLEKEIEQLRLELVPSSGLPTTMTLGSQDKPAPKPEVEFKASFTDGFHIKSTDGNFDLHIGGRWLEEYRYTFSRPSDVSGTGGGARTSVNTFYTREAFLSVDGTLYKNWGFKLNGDLAPAQTATVAGGAATNTAVSTGAIIEEAYVEWKELKEFRLLFGSFKQPASFETTDSPRFSALIQRSPLSRFSSNFDTGIKAYGAFMDSALTYELAVTNGRSHLANQGRDNNDDNDGKEYAVRLTTAPFVQDKDSFLKGLRIGGYATFAHEGQNNGLNPAFFGGGYATSPGTNIATNELAVTYLALPAGAGYRFYGDRYRVGGEFTYAYGPYMLRGEVLSRHDEVHKPGSAQGSDTYNNLLSTLGYYVESSFVLTGEDRIPNARIVPKNPFSLSEGGWGAVELAARFGAVSLDENVLRDIGVGLGRNGGANSNRAQSWTVGVNWWMVQNVRFMVDYMGEYYGSDGVQFSPLQHGSHMHGMLARFQVDF